MMHRGALFLLLVFGTTMARGGVDDAVDALDDFLTFSSADASVRARLSGTLELEGYWFQQPAPALIDAGGDALFNPRLTTFLDVQAGAYVYAFAQARADRGFDPSDDRLRGRLDEYAIRFTVPGVGATNLQVGKFATVVGNWVSRHGAWENPFVNAPLPYENLTGIWDEVAARNTATLLGWAHVRPRATARVPATDKYLRLPIIWGPSYATGVALSGALGKLTYAAELKNASLSSRPYSWTDDEGSWVHPTTSGQIAYTPNPMWTFGLSASRGAYLRPEAVITIPAGLNRGDYRQVVWAQDVRFGWHRLQLWAEAFESRFVIPRVGDADTFAYYVEGKYKLTARWYGALRWNEQTFGRMPDGTDSTRWGNHLSRLDVAMGFRISPHAQWKFQYSVEQEQNGARPHSDLWSTQLMLRF
jgi:hypothetical protein